MMVKLPVKKIPKIKMESQMKKNLPYFAYGSNLNLDDLKEWCSRYCFPFPVDHQTAIKAFFPDHEIFYNYFSPVRKGGVLNIRPCFGQAIPGVLFDLAPKGLLTLDEKEGVPFHYDRKIVTVITEGGEVVEALTYMAPHEKIKNGFVEPSQEYAEIVINGLQDFGIDNRMHTASASNERPPWITDKIFTYGTLMRGECRDNLLDFNENIISVQTGKTNGLLYDLGPFPGMVVSPGATSTVLGEIFHVQDVKKSLSVLDEIEGFGGYGEKESLYIRTIVTVNDSAGNSSPAWCYLFHQQYEHDKLIEGGNWRTRYEIS